MIKRRKFTCPQCGKPWSMNCDNPEGHIEVVCPTCLKVAYDQFKAEFQFVESMLPKGYIEVPPELQALHLGHKEFCARLTAYRLGEPLSNLLGPAQNPLQ